MAKQFFFGGDTGLTLEELERRNQVIAAYLGRNRAPRSVPEGIGQGIAAALGGYAQGRIARAGAGLRRDASANFSKGFDNYISGGMQPATAGNVPALPGTTSARGGADPELVAYIRDAATKRNIDPNVALKVAYSEGLRADPAEAWQSTIVNDQGRREPSYTPFQLLVGGPGTGFPPGMGNDFIAATGLDPRDRRNVRPAIDFALDQAVKGGWGPWYGAKDAGVGQWDGLPQRGASLQRAPGNMLAGGGNEAMADALRAADRSPSGVEMADASRNQELINRIQNADMEELKRLTYENQATMGPYEVDALRKRMYELQGREVPADAAPIPGLEQPAARPPVTRPVTPTPPGALAPAPSGSVSRGALPPAITDNLDRRMDGVPAPAMSAPRTIEGRTVQGTTQPGNRDMNRWNAFVQRSGSQQLADANPRKGILGFLTGMGPSTRLAGFPARPGVLSRLAGNEVELDPMTTSSTYPNTGRERLAGTLRGQSPAAPKTAEAQPRQMQVVQNQQQPNMQAINWARSVVSNSANTPAERQIALDILKQEMERVRPRTVTERLEQRNQELQLRKRQLEIDKAQRPETTDDIREFQFAQENEDFVDYMEKMRRAGADNITVSTGGGKFAGELGKNLADSVMEQYQSARDAAQLIETVNEGRFLLDEGAITGAGADWRVGALKYAQLAGLPVDEATLNNSEAFTAVMAQAVAKIIKQFGAGTGLSDADREYAKKMAAGDINLNEAAIRRIFDVTEKMARARIQSWQERVPQILESDVEQMLSVLPPAEYIAPSAGVPEGVDPELWKMMTPEERSLWQN